MSPEAKTRILQTLSAASLYLGLFGMLPYFLGDASDILPPSAKKYVTLISLSCAALAKACERIIAHVNQLP